MNKKTRASGKDSRSASPSQDSTMPVIGAARRSRHASTRRQQRITALLNNAERTTMLEAAKRELNGPPPPLRGWPLFVLGEEVYALETLVEKLTSELLGEYRRHPSAENMRLAGGFAELAEESRSRVHGALYRTFTYYHGGNRK